ncbi:MAG: hypothetical protein FJ102_26760 [Deltaproteobacteria bacterium]|nr:hypothetical protein [Deltaproteobacteria bacterium]
MRTFKDNGGREWTVEINVAALKRVRGLTGTDLMQVVEGSGGLIERLIKDPVLLCDVVYAVCKTEADQRSVSDEDFGRAMAGDAIEHATAALLEELVSFCPSPRDRRNLGRVLTATRGVMDKARDLVEKRIDRLVEGGELERIAEAALTGAGPPTPGVSSGGAPESPGSIPAP